MPLTNFFTYQLIPSNENCIRASIRINAEHAIFEGHFPDNPVTPGVTQVEIIRQILSTTLQKNLMLSEAKDIKYMNPILPDNMMDIQLEAKYSIDSGQIKVNCILSGKETTFTKIRGIFSEQ